MNFLTSSVLSTSFHVESGVFLSSCVSADDAIATMLSRECSDLRALRAANGWARMRGALVTDAADSIEEVNMLVKSFSYGTPTHFSRDESTLSNTVLALKSSP